MGSGLYLQEVISIFIPNSFRIMLVPRFFHFLSVIVWDFQIFHFLSVGVADFQTFPFSFGGFG